MQAGAKKLNKGSEGRHCVNAKISTFLKLSPDAVQENDRIFEERLNRKGSRIFSMFKLRSSLHFSEYCQEKLFGNFKSYR